MARVRIGTRAACTAAAWLAAWGLTCAAALELPGARWPGTVLPLAGAAATAAAAHGPRPWRTWLLGAALGNLAIGGCVAIGVPGLLANLCGPGFGRLNAGDGFALMLATWSLRARVGAGGAALLCILSRREGV